MHLDRYTHEPRVYRRAVAYGMPGVSVDGNDVEAVRDCVANAVVRARAGGGPTLVQPSPTAPPISLDLTAAAIATWPDPSSFWIR